MPKRKDISSVLVIGAGPIVIGQACEFDYSGTQACKALKEEGLRVILVNSNPATIMTDAEVADATYIEPINVRIIEKIIEKERPDSLLSTVGGQTALNIGLELARLGILEKYNIQMIGASVEAIEKAENRKVFNEAMAKIGLEVPKNSTVSSMEEALEALKDIGLPVVIRPSYTLGGSGGGIAETMEEFKEIIAYGLDISPTTQVLIDESIVGWKEYEMEVVRDKKDNAIIICSIENLDPMGVHTGDSITLAPALTLTDKEYQYMRNASIAVLREIGVETGGSNVQFAVNPKNGKLVVIEMNPRVSRSSALASKATGFPIAKVAAKLAIGYTLDEIQNDITKVTPASFEPSIDYVVTKIPRFNFEKFSDTEALLSSSMKSVGEVMSIGRSFQESFQKALNSLEENFNGLNSIAGKDPKILRELLKKPLVHRVLIAAEALRQEISVDEIYELSGIDPWFLREIKSIVEAEKEITAQGCQALFEDKFQFLKFKKMGFSDSRLADLLQVSEEQVRVRRHKLEIFPVFKSVDTCAAEFESSTTYLYSCYEGNGFQKPECESCPSDKKKVIVLGSGPNRIGQGIEFDYACVHGVQTLSSMGYESIMVNCNPETVSTDYDTSDKLYFEPLSFEYVYELILAEQKKGELLGVIVQFGGQTPLKLARALEKVGIPILGTSPDSIDLCEDRERFQKLIQDLKLRQPENSICYKAEEVGLTIEDTVGYPVVTRPSHVLGGRAMSILKSKEDLNHYLKINSKIISDGPILIDRFLENAIEVDVDAICDGEEVYIAGIMEHIEQAGVHSGDSACVLPTYSLSEKMVKEIRKNTVKLAKAVKALGLVNIQFAIQDEKLYIIEVNPRASRTTPFVAKTTGFPLVRVATQIMMGKKLSDFKLPEDRHGTPHHYAIKEVVLPFARFPSADILLTPEMKSTGEAMGWDKDLDVAFAKAQLGAMNPIPHCGTALVSYSKDHQDLMQETRKSLQEVGFNVITLGENSPSNLAEKIQSGEVNFAACVDGNKENKHLRRLLISSRVPYFSTHEATLRAIKAIPKSQVKNFTVTPIQSLMNQ